MMGAWPPGSPPGVAVPPNGTQTGSATGTVHQPYPSMMPYPGCGMDQQLASPIANSASDIPPAVSSPTLAGSPTAHTPLNDVRAAAPSLPIEPRFNTAGG